MNRERGRAPARGKEGGETERLNYGHAMRTEDAKTNKY